MEFSCFYPGFDVLFSPDADPAETVLKKRAVFAFYKSTANT